MFDMSNDSHLFRTRAQLETEGFTLHGNRFQREGETYLPLYEAKMIHQFDHRFASVSAPTSGSRIRGRSEPFLEHQSAIFMPSARSYVKEESVFKKVGNSKWLVGFRDVTGAVANIRTTIFTIVPIYGFGNSLPVLEFSITSISNKACALVANFNSFVLDFVTRHKISGVHLNFFIVKQLPVIPPEHYTPDLLAFIVPRVLELTYTAWDLRPFADDVWAEANDERGRETNDERGMMNDERIHHSSFITHHSPLIPHPSSLQTAILRQWEANKIATGGGHAGATPPEWAETNDERGRETNDERRMMNDESVHHSSLIIHHSPFPRPPFKWDDTRRAHIRAELDGLYGHLYGLSRDELAYILDTFPIVRRKDEAQFGEYRTKRLVLAAYDKLNDEF